MRGYEDPLPDSTADLAALYQHLLSKPVPAPQTLIIDGLDEVTTWNIAPYLSRSLPANFHVIITVRDAEAGRSGDFGIPAKQTAFLDLRGLGRTELGDALSAIDGWAAAFATDDSLLDEVVRVAAYDTDAEVRADPTYVRFLLEDAASGALTPATLARQPRRWGDYLENWWNDLIRVADDQVARDFFGTMAAALGPLRRTDLEQISPSLRAASGGMPTRSGSCSMRRAGSSSGTKKTAGSSRGGGCGNTCWASSGLGPSSLSSGCLPSARTGRASRASTHLTTTSRT